MNRGLCACLPFIAIQLAVALLCCNATSTANRRDLDSVKQETYLNPAPPILPGPVIDPAPIVLPSNAIDATDEIEPAGVIQPAPQIEPAPAILPSDAIKEKDRSYPPAKRNGLRDFHHSRQAVNEIVVIEHQMAASRRKKKPAQTQNNNTVNNSATQAGAKEQQVVIIPIIQQLHETSTKGAHKSSRTDLNSEQENRDNEYPITHTRVVKNRAKNDFKHDNKITNPHKRKNNTKMEKKLKQQFVKLQVHKKEKQSKITKYAFYKRPKTYDKSKKGPLKKNGARLFPGTLYVPTPFHFTLKTTTAKSTPKTPTKKPTTSTNPTKQKPCKKGGSRLIPTQTGFIKPTKKPPKTDKGPMQHKITHPTKKMISQARGGCTTIDKNNIQAISPKQGKFKLKQTMFIPQNKQKHHATNSAPCKPKFSTQQTFHIKQHRFFAHGFKTKQKDFSAIISSYKRRKKHKKIKKSSLNKVRLIKALKNSVKSKNKPHSDRHAKNWRRIQTHGASVDKVFSRKRRQLMFPLGFGSQEQASNPLLQQLLPIQPAVPGAQEGLGQIIPGQIGQQLLSQGGLLANQNLLSPFLRQPQGLVQQQPLQQSPLPQTSNSPLLVQPQLALNPALQPAAKLPSYPVLSNLEYQSPQVAGAVIPVQYQPQSFNGQSRQSIPRMVQYTEENEYPQARRYNHRFRSSKRNERYPYDSYGSFEDTYGQSPGVLDDLRDISSRMSEYDHYDNYHHRPREWVEDGYDDVRSRHHRHHRKPFHAAEYSREYEPDDDSISRLTLTGYQDDQAPAREGIDITSLNPTSEQVNTDPKEEESLHDDDETVENSVKEAKPKEEKPVSVIQSQKADNEESDEAQFKRSETIKQLDKDAVMHLDFDETAQKKDNVKDISGNQNDAHLTDGATITAKTLGTCGRGAILRKGEISYNGKNFKRKPTKEVSVSMWVKSKTPGFIRWFDESDSPKKSFFASTKGASVGKNHWTHLAGTFDTRTGIARIYVNGKLKVEKYGKKNNGLPQDFTSTGIGRKYGDSHVTFLDDVYMFDRVITPEEVLALYKKCQFNRMILHYGFQHWNASTQILEDQSGLQNNATLKGGAKVRVHDCDKCGACLDLQSTDNSQVYLNASKYHQKPTSAVSISAWVNLNRTKGLHSIFQAMKDGNSNNNVYGLDVINGKVHWQSKDKHGETIFDALTNEVTIPEGLWTHVTGTYSSKTGEAKIYVNGLLRASFHNTAEPALSTDWNRAIIGGENKAFDGLLDEFFMYNWELDSPEVRFVSKYCADKPKLVSFTVKVPIL